MSHNHCHHDEKSCTCCCHEGVCGHHHHADDHQGDFAHQLIEMADEAWMEVLKEKIKEQIRSASGSNLDELAKLISDANHARWKHKMSLHHGVHGFQDALSRFFHKG